MLYISYFSLKRQNREIVFDYSVWCLTVVLKVIYLFKNVISFKQHRPFFHESFLLHSSQKVTYIRLAAEKQWMAFSLKGSTLSHLLDRRWLARMLGFAARPPHQSHSEVHWRGRGVQGCDKKVAEFRPKPGSNPGSRMDLWGGILSFIPPKKPLPQPCPQFPRWPCWGHVSAGRGWRVNEAQCQHRIWCLHSRMSHFKRM